MFGLFGEFGHMELSSELSNSMRNQGVVDSLSLFVALLCACIVIGHLIEESRWINESITAILVASIIFFFHLCFWSDKVIDYVRVRPPKLLHDNDQCYWFGWHEWHFFFFLGGDDHRVYALEQSSCCVRRGRDHTFLNSMKSFSLCIFYHLSYSMLGKVLTLFGIWSFWNTSC